MFFSGRSHSSRNFFQGGPRTVFNVKKEFQEAIRQDWTGQSSVDTQSPLCA